MGPNAEDHDENLLLRNRETLGRGHPFVTVCCTRVGAGVSGIQSFELAFGHTVRGSLKDGAYYCYCAYVLRISRYSDFLSPMLTNTGIFLRGLKLPEEVDLSKYSWYPKRKLGVTMHF